MKFTPTRFDGVWLITLEPKCDGRGRFVRTYCEDEFRKHGLHTHWPQCNETLTVRRGSIRGMHWQRRPAWEVKLVRCIRGYVWDVVVDVRPDSATFGQWEAFEISAASLVQIHIPEGFAHGFQTLCDDCILHYQMGTPYQPGLSAGFRWNDPSVGIAWPLPAADLSPRDAELPPLADAVRPSLIP